MNIMEPLKGLLPEDTSPPHVGHTYALMLGEPGTLSRGGLVSKR